MTVRVVDLHEYQTSAFAAGDIPQDVVEALYRDHTTRFEIDFPSIKTGGEYRIRPLSWVGYVPLTERLALRLNPKVPVRSVFRMLEYAFGLKSFRLENELAGMATLAEVYSELAVVLARRTSARWRRGLHRAYVPRRERVQALRGRLDIAASTRKPWSTTMPCDFQEHTADIDDNRLLAWTFHRLQRSAAIAERARGSIRHAFQRLNSVVNIRAFHAQDCVGRRYDRLNADYEVLHSLCRFFLEYSGPTHGEGDRAMMPFLINMAELFERFVAKWLAAHLPASLRLLEQHRVTIGASAALDFNVDIVIADATTGVTRFVLDTKYKTGAIHQPDVYQLVAYATAMHSTEAVLVYPSSSSATLDEKIGGIRIRSAVFDLGGDVERAGQAFLAEILGHGLSDR